ncbi:MAG: winged helix-turn-helix transcriptional regulator [Candidatus Nealsonbacteria bacterium]|nr:winged helix-turn-helix transcriptional regulator [Candidatus Nealsonbacteria bacterium]
MPSTPRNSEPAKTAARWIELVELIRVSGRMFRDLLASHLQKHSLGESQFSALWICRKAPGMGLSQQDITAKLAVSPAAVSGLVEQLRRRGLLEGRRAESDRRRQLWRLTPDGKDVLDAVLSDLATWAASLQSHLGCTDPDDLLLSIGELARTLSQQAGAGSLSARVANPCVCESADGDGRADTLCREGAA